MALKKFDVIIVGGGLAGLTAATHLSKKGISLALFEKDEFPHHKVCGEYLSNEVLPYLDRLEVPIQDVEPPQINRLFYTSQKSGGVETQLPLGGIGISRYALDDLLFRSAKKAGAQVFQQKVLEIDLVDEEFKVVTSEEIYSAKHVIGAFGKRSNLDKILNRKFFKKPASWLAVKNHYSHDTFPADLVALNTFDGGYCGLSRTETGAINLCYLATYKSFKRHKDPDDFEQNVLRKNPFLDDFLAEASPVFEKPLTIAQISFDRKEAVQGHILMTGDAAGLIHPLCGNGMAMAIHSGKMASEVLLQFFTGKISEREQVEKIYREKWKKEFNSRLKMGRTLQKILLNDSLANLSHKVISAFPFVLPQIIKKTHGSPLL